jgi:hypothetical protein
MPSATKLKAAGLWERTSAAGNRYLTGRLGGVKVLILENHDRAVEDEPTHRLFFVDGEKPRETQPAQNRKLQRQRTPYRHPTSVEPALRREPLPADGADDLWRA